MQRTGRLTLSDILGVGTLFVMFLFLMPLLTDIAANTGGQVGFFLQSLIYVIPVVMLALPTMMIFTSQADEPREQRRRRRRRGRP